MFNKILIANRGEIACRVAATCQRLGVASVAVYSDADATAKHVAACDEAVHIGEASAAHSYLRIERIIAAARVTGAQAIHPGYGFLSENEAFARACDDAGLVFIGPPVGAIAAMGSKAAAKALMQSAAVPLVPGYHGDDQDGARLQREADDIGYPVLLKASAGGGGKGMRVVERSADFAAALASCQREAASSFGNDRVLIEKYLTRPRHVEVQVFADRHGNAVYLFDRDCSVQRRHQKVLEEAPAPGLDERVRRAMGAAAVAAARAVGYVGAGTVEFIMTGADFYFMEMNTRLQVEHPVTEMVTGLDLVEWQLRVAAGEPLPLAQAQLECRGHALEARLYAEHPARGFLPSTGTLKHLRMPAGVEFQVSETAGGGAGGAGVSGGAAAGASGARAGVRIDSGVREGDTITPFYDPMIAKLIVHGATRAEALARMRRALQACEIVGPHTNVEFLYRLVTSAPFSSADLDTELIERHHDALFAPQDKPVRQALALACAALLARGNDDGNRAGDGIAQGSPNRLGDPRISPWDSLAHWRLNGGYAQSFVWRESDSGVRHTLAFSRDGAAQTLTFVDTDASADTHANAGANADASANADANVSANANASAGANASTNANTSADANANASANADADASVNASANAHAGQRAEPYQWWRGVEGDRRAAGGADGNRPARANMRNDACKGIHDDAREYGATLGNARVTGRVFVEGDTFYVFCLGAAFAFEWQNLLAHAADIEHGEGRLTAPMPGKVVAVLVEPGAMVEKSAPLIVMEAMKMEHTIGAPAAGKVTQVLYAVGDQVADGAQLLVLEAREGAK